MASRLHRCAILCLAVVAAVVLVAVPALAVEMGPGTKNFTPPRGVPNYFNNEAEPFLGSTDSPETGYPRALVSGRVAHRYAVRRAGRYRGRTMIVRGRAVAVRGRAIAVRGRRAAGGHLSTVGRRVATRAYARPVKRGAVLRGGLHTVRAVHAIRAVYRGHAERRVDGVRVAHRIDGFRPAGRVDGVRALHRAAAGHRLDGAAASRGAHPARIVGAVHRVSGHAVARPRAPPAKRRG